MEILSNDFETNVGELDSRLRVRENFDLIRREMAVGEDRLVFYYIDGFIKDGEMLRLIASGAQVLHDRSVEMARDARLPLEVLSSFHPGPGTIVGPME